MAVFEVICTVAATLWIGFVVAALVIGYRITAKLRARRRRINRLFDAVRAPLGFRRRDAWHRRWRDGVLRYYGVPQRSGINGYWRAILESALKLQRRNEYR
ncbi:MULTISPECIES: hypothetical protein [unclassified Mycobacterium]|uniref:hypothetical protein n=1 Tax=unclassified Mycobacterium TaxID=2642494 RepID=UPI0029C8100F|nr:MULTISPECIES: hypothetical protein [unclassified Mycobacterium]